MKRKASSALEEERDDGEAGEPPKINEYLLADEILPRLPMSATAAFAVGTYRRILTGLDYWQFRNRLLPRPHIACFVGRHGGGERTRAHHDEFHFHHGDAAGSSPAEAAEPPAVVTRADLQGPPLRLAGTCNGLVLLTAPWDDGNRARGLLLNPASGDEVAVVLDLAYGGGGGPGVFRCFCGLGYSPATGAYKALVCARDFFPLCQGCAGELLLVPLAGAGGRQELTRTVAKLPKMSRRREDYFSSLSMDGAVYVLTDHGDDYDTTTEPSLLAVDVDGETATSIPLPPRSTGPYMSELMEVWGRPCVATGGHATTELWALALGHRWERRCTLPDCNPCPALRYPVTDAGQRSHVEVRGAWDCGGGLLFVLFDDGHGLTVPCGGLGEGETTAAALASVTACAQQQPAESPSSLLALAELVGKGTFCWGYQPTLVPPARVFGGSVWPKQRDGLRHFTARRSWLPDSATPRRRCLDVLMKKMMGKR